MTKGKLADGKEHSRLIDLFILFPSSLPDTCNAIYSVS